MGELNFDGVCSPWERLLHRPLWLLLFPVAHDLQSCSLAQLPPAGGILSAIEIFQQPRDVTTGTLVNVD
jgi:hypothetical protein